MANLYLSFQTFSIENKVSLYDDNQCANLFFWKYWNFVKTLEFVEVLHFPKETFDF